jgi:hypothetical protein
MTDIKSIAPKATPMPIPALALVEKPPLLVGDANAVVDGWIVLDRQESELPGQLMETTLEEVAVLVVLVVSVMLGPAAQILPG